jgi:hypothetical protein
MTVAIGTRDPAFGNDRRRFARRPACHQRPGVLQPNAAKLSVDFTLSTFSQFLKTRNVL